MKIDCYFCNNPLNMKMVCNIDSCVSKQFVVGNFVEIIDFNRYGTGKIQDIIHQPVYKVFSEQVEEHLKNRSNCDLGAFETVYLVSFDKEFYGNVLYPHELRHHVIIPGTVVLINQDNSLIEAMILKVEKYDGSNNPLIKYLAKKKDGMILSILETQIEKKLEIKPSLYLKLQANPVDVLINAWVEQMNSEFFGDVLSSISSSNIEEINYQISAAINLLKNERTRMILADDVGLGKTIEVGLYLSERLYRQKSRRVLLIMGKKLLQSFRKKLKEFFDIECADSKLEKIKYNEKSGILTLDDQENNIYLVGNRIFQDRSIEKIKELYKVQWDIIVVDEAQNIQKKGQNTIKQNYRLISKLISPFTSVIFMSATPLQNNYWEIYSLLQMLDSNKFSDYKIDEFEKRIEDVAFIYDLIEKIDNKNEIIALSDFQRKYLQEFAPQTYSYLSSSDPMIKSSYCVDSIKKELLSSHFLSRYVVRNRRDEVLKSEFKLIPEKIEIKLTEDEQNFYDKIVERCPPKLRMFFQTFMNSSFDVLVESVRKVKNRNEIKKSDEIIRVYRYILQNETNETDLQEDESEEVDFDDEEDLQAENYSSLNQTKEQLERDLDSEQTLDISRIEKNLTNPLSSKKKRLVALLETLFFKDKIERIVIFTSFLKTIAELKKELEFHLKKEGIEILVVSGKSDDVDNTINEFNNKKPVILISSDIVSEGVDFPTCNHIINYDLHWNPMKLIQRIGRIDRFRRTSDKKAYFFKVCNTVDDQIWTEIKNKYIKVHKTINLSSDFIKTLFKNEIDDKLINLKGEDTKIEKVFGRIEQKSISLIKEFIASDNTSKEKTSKRFLTPFDFNLIYSLGWVRYYDYLINFKYDALKGNLSELNFLLPGAIGFKSDLYKELYNREQNAYASLSTNIFGNRSQNHDLIDAFISESHKKEVNFLTPRNVLLSGLIGRHRSLDWCKFSYLRFDSARIQKIITFLQKNDTNSGCTFNFEEKLISLLLSKIFRNNLNQETKEKLLNGFLSLQNLVNQDLVLNIYSFSISVHRSLKDVVYILSDYQGNEYLDISKLLYHPSLLFYVVDFKKLNINKNKYLDPSNLSEQQIELIDSLISNQISNIRSEPGKYVSLSEEKIKNLIDNKEHFIEEYETIIQETLDHQFLVLEKLNPYFTQECVEKLKQDFEKKKQYFKIRLEEYRKTVDLDFNDEKIMKINHLACFVIKDDIEREKE